MLLISFGALVAAFVPVLLAATAVVAAFGLLGPISQLFPLDDSVKTVVLLIGMAVGVDYALFYVVRSREERLRGASAREALERTSRTSGRSVLIAGTTVAIAMAGQFVVGSDVFNGIAAGTIVVVACAVAGSVTVLPALLQLLGPRVDRGRIRFLPQLATAGESRFWTGVVDRRAPPPCAVRVRIGRAADRVGGARVRDAGGEAELGRAVVRRTVRAGGPDHGRVPEHVLAGDRGGDLAGGPAQRGAAGGRAAGEPRNKPRPSPTRRSRSVSARPATRWHWACR